MDHLCGGCRFGGDSFIRSCLGASEQCRVRSLGLCCVAWRVRCPVVVCRCHRRLAVGCVVCCGVAKGVASLAGIFSPESCRGLPAAAACVRGLSPVSCQFRIARRFCFAHGLPMLYGSVKCFPLLAGSFGELCFLSGRCSAFCPAACSRL